jgi:hypothetical protein
MQPNINPKLSTPGSSSSEILIPNSTEELNMASRTLSTLASTSIRAVSIGRSFAGGIMFFTPQIGAHLFGVPLAPETNILARLFGIRDLALGGLLWGARSRLATAISSSDPALVKEAGRDLDRLLHLGMAIDSVDILSSIVSIWSGDMGGRAIFWVPCGAAMFVGLQWLAVRHGKL